MTRGFGRFLRQNTIALLALFLALGGTTYAASTALIGKNSVASPQVVNGSLQTKDLSKKARRALKGNRGPRGLQGAQGAAGAQGAKGATGAQGVQGPAGTAVAYATVEPGGTVYAPESKSITDANIVHPATGVYCFRNLSFTPKTIMVAGDNADDANTTLATGFVWRGAGIGGCTLGTDFARVRTVISTTGALTDLRFKVWFE